MKKLLAFLFGFIQGSIVTLLVGTVILINEYRKMDKDRPVSSVGYRSIWDGKKKTEEKTEEKTA